MNLKKKVIGLAILILAAIGVFWVSNSENKAKQGLASLSWNANSEPDLAGYKIYYGMNPRTGDCPISGYEKVIDAKNKVNYEISNLESGKTYYFSVTSYNSAGKESCFSKEMKKTIGSPIVEKIKNYFSK